MNEPIEECPCPTCVDARATQALMEHLRTIRAETWSHVADDGRAVRPLRSETPALTHAPQRAADAYLVERDATTLIATLPTSWGNPIHLPGLDFTNRYHAVEVKPDPITRVRLHLMPMTDHDRNLATLGRVTRFMGHTEDERKIIVARRKGNRPYGVRSQGTFPCKTAVDPVESAYLGLARLRTLESPDGQVMPMTVNRYRTSLTNGGYTWVGFRRVIVKRAEPKARKVARVKRAKVGAKGKRGPLVRWWSMSTRSIPRHWAKATDAQRATADTLEATLRTLTDGKRTRPQLVGHDSNGRDHVIVTDGALSTVRRDVPNSRTFPIREYSRRAAMAGLTLLD